MDDLPTRWEVELEFVQSLANIPYVNFLAQNGYLADPDFIAYLEYLNYWKDAKYARFLVYPNCLHILTLLQKESFRRNIVNPDFMNMLMNDMVKKWQRNEADTETFAAKADEGSGPENENGHTDEGKHGNKFGALGDGETASASPELHADEAQLAV